MKIKKCSVKIQGVFDWRSEVDAVSLRLRSGTGGAVIRSLSGAEGSMIRRDTIQR